MALAPRPTQPLDKALPGAGLLAAVAVGKYCDHLPLYRLEDVFARHGVELSRATLCRWARAGAERLRPLYERMVARVRASRIIWTDDTPMPVLDPQLDRTRKGRLWVYCGDRDHPYSVYDYTPSRKRDGPMTFLRDFSGYLQADAFAGYDGIYAARSVEQVLCWAHARRKFYEAKAAHPELAHQALAWIARLYEVERAAKGLSPDERLGLRQERSLPLLGQLRDWLTVVEPRVLPKSPLGQALGYVLPRWEGLTRYCQDGELSIDNNLSERTIRPCTIGRKNYLFFGSDRGGHTAAVWYSLVASCKTHQVEPWAYLRDVLGQLAKFDALTGATVDERLAALLPDRWLAAHPTARRKWSR